MLAVVIGLVLVLLVSVGIVLLVALPHLRSGSRILTPEGERTVKQAQGLADRTIHTLPGLRPGREERLSPAEGGPGPVIHRPAEPAPAAPEAPDEVVLPDTSHAEQVRTMFPGQRPSPIDSGPIQEPDVEYRPELPETRPVEVVDLRAAEDAGSDTRAGQA